MCCLQQAVSKLPCPHIIHLRCDICIASSLSELYYEGDSFVAEDHLCNLIVVACAQGHVYRPFPNISGYGNVPQGLMTFMWVVTASFCHLVEKQGHQSERFLVPALGLVSLLFYKVYKVYLHEGREIKKREELVNERVMKL